MPLPPNPDEPGRAWPLLLSAAGFLLAFRAIGATFLRGYTLDLGSITLPSPLYTVFLLVWAVFGALALVSAAAGFARVAQRGDAAETFTRDWLGPSDRRFMLVAGVFAAALPLLFHLLVLGGARLTDDEAAYHFAAQLLSQGRLSAPSHPAREFFDNAFMINDGRFYAKYMLGWPLLLAPGAALNAPFLMNPLYQGLTVPALYMILRHATDSAWARAGTVLFATAPMLLFGAATMMSHTSCICVLAWAWWLLIRGQQPGANLRHHLGFALLLALAFFIRPTSTIGIGGVLALAWVGALRSVPNRERVQRAGAFLLVAAAAIAVLLAVNHAQTGDPLELAYARNAEYEAQNQPFAALPVEYRHLQFHDPVRMIATSAVGFLRLNFDLFGWPIGLLVLFLAVGDRRARLAWYAALGFAVVHLPTVDMGIDSFGPVHWYEIALPVLVLCTLGLERTHRWLSHLEYRSARVVVPCLLCAAIACAWIGYMPVRVSALVQMAQASNAPIEAVAQAGVRDAVVFAPRPWAVSCDAPTQSFAFFRPNNDPDMSASVLWANHITVEKDRAMMRHFPGRRGYVLARLEDCTLGVLPVEEIDPELAKILDAAAKRAMSKKPRAAKRHSAPPVTPHRPTSMRD